MADSLEQTVRRLMDLEEIKSLKVRYCRCVDFKQWEEFETLFTDDLQVDFGESTSGARTRAEWLDAVQRHFEGGVSIHQVHVPEITFLDDDHATGIWPMFDLVEMPETSAYESHTGWGHYTEEYRRVDGRWLVSKVQLTRLKRVRLDKVPPPPTDHT